MHPTNYQPGPNFERNKQWRAWKTRRHHEDWGDNWRTWGPAPDSVTKKNDNRQAQRDRKALREAAQAAVAQAAHAAHAASSRDVYAGPLVDVPPGDEPLRRTEAAASADASNPWDGDAASSSARPQAMSRTTLTYTYVDEWDDDGAWGAGPEPLQTSEEAASANANRSAADGVAAASAGADAEIAAEPSTVGGSIQHAAGPSTPAVSAAAASRSDVGVGAAASAGADAEIAATPSAAAEDRSSRQKLPLTNSLKRDWAKGVINSRQVQEYAHNAHLQGAYGSDRPESERSERASAASAAGPAEVEGGNSCEPLRLTTPPSPRALPKTMPGPPRLSTDQPGTYRQGTAMKRASTAKSLRRTSQGPSVRAASAPDPRFPMPDRLPPFVLEGPHEVRPDLDVDWTLSDNWDLELQRREERNQLIKDKLLAGRAACYRSSGWSLYPRVHNNDLCTYEPVTSADQVEQNDIVFCEVMPRRRFYAHLVLRKEWGGEQWGMDEWFFTISNIKGRENGWTTIDNIYGRLVQVTH
jgi:hypothetical protein